jgi:hypothetical protein
VSPWTKSTARMPRAWAAGRGVDPGVMQDLPYRGGTDPVAEPDELALHPPVPPRRVICCPADHELADRGCRGRPPGTPPARVIPLACDQPPVPGEECRRGHREHLAPSLPGDQPGQCREPQPVGWLVADPADLAAKHHVLVPQHPEFGILGHLTPGQHHQAAQQAAHEQVGDREDHSAVIPTPEHCSGHARSSNRAPQAGCRSSGITSRWCSRWPSAWSRCTRWGRSPSRSPARRSYWTTPR